MSDQTPFPPTGGGVERTPTDQEMKMRSMKQMNPSLFTCTDPCKAYFEVVPLNDPLYQEYMRVRRVSTQYGGIVMCHSGWQHMLELSLQGLSALSTDGKDMRFMDLPWFSAAFTREHAEIVANAFPHRRIYFEGTEIFPC